MLIYIQEDIRVLVDEHCFNESDTWLPGTAASIELMGSEESSSGFDTKFSPIVN